MQRSVLGATAVAIAMLTTAIMLTMSAAAAATVPGPATAPAPPEPYSSSAVSRCLSQHGVSNYNEAFKVRQPTYRKLFPKGITAMVQGLQPASPKIEFDDGVFFFFRNPHLARVGEGKLARLFVYARGVPKLVALLLQAHGTPTPSQAKSLYSVTGNIVEIWAYPRHHRMPTNRLLGQCLGSTASR